MKNIHYKQLIAFAAILTLSACNNSKNRTDKSQEQIAENRDSVITIQLSGSSRYKHEFAMSEIVKDIQYIPLETNDDCLLGNRIGQPVFTKDYIFIVSGGILFQFDRNGKFVKRINRKGQGPGECDTRDFGIVEKTQLIYIYDNWKLSVNIYDFNGKYLDVIRNPFSQEPDGSSGSRMECDVKGNIFFNFDNFGSMKYQYTVMDNKGEFLYKSPNPILYDNKKKIWRFSIYPSAMYFYDNTLYYNYVFNDTVFRINDDYSCSPAYIIKIPKRLTLEENIRTGTNEIPYSDFSGHIQHKAIREDHHYIYIYNNYNPYSEDFIPLFSRYDKQKKELLDNINPKLKNDFDGGMDIELAPFKQTDNVFIYTYWPHEMQEKLTDGHFAETEVEFPEKRDSLKTMINNLPEDDNPVLMIVTLK
ncbi:MAG: 6-bladed beta-propeller [Tannerella sp.]|jgi:hypothetical protein|nr:6-bladed beta-propeller [Tannerella sp.]